MPTDPVVFTHIPKTAGASIHWTMQMRFGLDRTFIVTGPDAMNELRTDQAIQHRVVYVGGHLPRAQAIGIYPSARLVASARRPLERILSHFFYMLRNGAPQQAAPDEDLIERFRRFYRGMIGAAGDNLICRYLGGAPDAAAAIRSVESNYALVWSSARTASAWPRVYALAAETVPGSAPEAGELHDVHVAEVAGGADDLTKGARPSDYLAFLPEEDRERLLQENAEDIAFQDWLEREHDGLWVAAR